jgi:type IV secretory pathway TrbD component
MMLLVGVTCFLFILWSLYLLVRFAVAFWFAAHMLRHKWTRDDRSLTT